MKFAEQKRIGRNLISAVLLLLAFGIVCASSKTRSSLKSLASDTLELIDNETNKLIEQSGVAEKLEKITQIKNDKSGNPSTSKNQEESLQLTIDESEDLALSEKLEELSQALSNEPKEDLVIAIHNEKGEEVYIMPRPNPVGTVSKTDPAGEQKKKDEEKNEETTKTQDETEKPNEYIVIRETIRPSKQQYDVFVGRFRNYLIFAVHGTRFRQAPFDLDDNLRLDASLASLVLEELETKEDLILMRHLFVKMANVEKAKETARNIMTNPEAIETIFNQEEKETIYRVIKEYPTASNVPEIIMMHFLKGPEQKEESGQTIKLGTQKRRENEQSNLEKLTVWLNTTFLSTLQDLVNTISSYITRLCQSMIRTIRERTNQNTTTVSNEQPIKSQEKAQQATEAKEKHE